MTREHVLPPTCAQVQVYFRVIEWVWLSIRCSHAHTPRYFKFLVRTLLIAMCCLLPHVFFWWLLSFWALTAASWWLVVGSDIVLMECIFQKKSCALMFHIKSRAKTNIQNNSESQTNHQIFYNEPCEIWIEYMYLVQGTSTRKVL